MTALVGVSCAACSAGHPAARQSTAAQHAEVPKSSPTAGGAPAAATLPPGDVSGLPQGVAVDAAFTMPQGWRIDSTGAWSSKRYVAFTAVGPSSPQSAEAGAATVGDPRNAEIWVVDRATGRLYRSPRQNPQWIAVVEIPAGGWMLRQEKIQASSGCADLSDCWNWKLYAQELPAGQPVLLEQSSHPASQTMVPFPVTDGKTFAWQQAADSGTGGVTDTWHPGDAHPTRVTADPGQRVITIDSDYLYEEDHAQSPTGAASLSTVFRYNLDGGGKVQVATFTGSCCAAIGGDSIAFFPGSRDAGLQVVSGRLHIDASLQKFGSLGNKLQGFYYAGWVTPDWLMVSSATGYELTSRTATIDFPPGLIDSHAIHPGQGWATVVVSSSTGRSDVVAVIHPN